MWLWHRRPPRYVLKLYRGRVRIGTLRARTREVAESTAADVTRNHPTIDVRITDRRDTP